MNYDIHEAFDLHVHTDASAPYFHPVLYIVFLPFGELALQAV